MIVQKLGWNKCVGAQRSGLSSLLLKSNCCRTRSENHRGGLLVRALSSTLVFAAATKNSFCFPLGCSSCRVTMCGSRGDRAGRVHLETCVGNCPALLVRSKETPDGVSVWFSEKALHEWDSSDGPIHHKSQLLSLQCIRDMVYEKLLGDYLFFPLLCICVRSCLEQALCLLVACETVSSRKLQKYFMKCSNKNIHVVQPMQNNTFGLEHCMQFL